MKCSLATSHILPAAAFALLIGLDWGGLAHAGLVATDLNTGGTDTGFSGGWTGSSNLAIINAPDLAYPYYGITQSGTTERVYRSNTGHPDRQDMRALAAPMSGEIWFSVLVHVPSGGSFAGLSFNHKAGAPSYSHAGSGLRVLITDSQLEIRFSDNVSHLTGSFAADTTHLILGKMVVGAGNDTLSVWVDPNLLVVAGPGDLPAPDYTTTTVDFADSIVDLGVPGAIGTASEVYVDAIWLSDAAGAFVDVTGAGGSDTTPPSIMTLSPANGAIDVAVDTDLVITFDEPVQKGTGNIVIQQTAGGTFETIPVTSPAVTIAGATVTIMPSSDLDNLTGYSIGIDSGAFKDFADPANDFAGITGIGTWDFTTVLLDIIPPTVVSLSPTKGATGVASDTALVITFDEDVKKGAGDVVIHETGGGIFETIPITSPNVTVSGAVVTIAPSTKFAKGGSYYVEIAGSAIEDLIGNPFGGISGESAWSFQVSSGLFVAADLNTGGADQGFSGGWIGSNNVRITDAPDLTYALYGITQSGTPTKVYSANTSHGDRQDARNLAVPMLGEIWFTFLINVPAEGNFAGLSFNYLNPSQPYSHVQTDARVLMTPSQLQVDIGSGLMAGTGTFAAGSTHLVLGQMILAPGNDTLNVWVDPDLTASLSSTGDLPAANFSSTTVDFADDVVSIGVPNSDATGSDAVHVDALRLSDTFTAFLDVTGVEFVTQPDPDASTVTASPTSVPADGTTTSTITVALKNASGVAVANREVMLENTAGAGLAVINPGTPQTTDANGVATFTVSCKYVGTEVFTATDITDAEHIVITQTPSVDFTIVSQTSLVGGGTPPPPDPSAPQTSLQTTVAAPPASVSAGQLTDSTPAGENAGAGKYAATDEVIRVTEYALTDGDFSGTVTSLILDRDLAADYFILVRGSRSGDGRSMPDNDYARVVSVPGGRGGLADSGAADAVSLQRAAAETDWEGVITVVECLAPDNPAGFKLVDAVVTTLSGTSGSAVCTPWSDGTQVVPFGGYRGGGVELTETPGSRYEGTGAYVRLTCGSAGMLNWERDGGGEALLDATMTTFVVEWGSEWTVQHANVAGTSGGGGADEVGEYTTATIAPVARANTWVWGTGIRADAGIGDCAESCLVTLGDGVTVQATESSVAVGSEYPDAYNFDVYALTHPGLAVDHRFKPDGDRDALDLPVPVNAAPAGARFGWVYNGCSGTSSRFPRPRFWARYTADDAVTVSRGYDGADFPAWIQGVDFSGLNTE